MLNIRKGFDRISNKNFLYNKHFLYEIRKGKSYWVYGEIIFYHKQWVWSDYGDAKTWNADQLQQIVNFMKELNNSKDVEM